MVQIAPGNQISPLLKRQGITVTSQKAFVGFVKHHGEGSFLERGDYLGAVSLCFFVGNFSLQQGDAHPTAAEDTDPGQQRADEGHHFLGSLGGLWAQSC